MISYLVSVIFKLIYLVIIIVCLLSWMPIFDIRKQPLASLISLYDKILAPFKAIIPPIGMIDISPLIAFFVLNILEQLLLRILASLGL